MTTALTVLCILCALCAVASAIFTKAARAEAQRVLDDALRMQTIVDGLLTVTPHGPDPEWTVEHRGVIVARGHDLGVLIDEVNIYG